MAIGVVFAGIAMKTSGQAPTSVPTKLKIASSVPQGTTPARSYLTTDNTGGVSIEKEYTAPITSSEKLASGGRYVSLASQSVAAAITEATPTTTGPEPLPSGSPFAAESVSSIQDKITGAAALFAQSQKPTSAICKDPITGVEHDVSNLTMLVKNGVPYPWLYFDARGHFINFASQEKGKVAAYFAYYGLTQ